MYSFVARHAQVWPLVVLVAAQSLVTSEVCAAVVRAAQTIMSAPPTTEDFSFDRTIDQSGLSFGYVSGVTDFDAYVASAPIHVRSNQPSNFAASFSLAPQNVDFDLGSTLQINKLAFWNYPFQSPGGVTAIEVYASSVSNFLSSSFLGAFLPINDGNGISNAVQVFDLAEANGRFVRLRVTGIASGGFGFSEVAFGTSVPEPTLLTVCLSVVGFCCAVRRNRSPYSPPA